MTELQEIARQIASCTGCSLSETRNLAVSGEGPEQVDLMFIGEAPGHYEDMQGRPFVGAAGQFLDRLLESIGLSREQVFIANTLKCRPPNNRDPNPGEIAACSHYLDRQIELLQPKVIVTLGRHSLGRFLPGETISKAHGRPRRKGDYIIYPMYHPAAALHQPSLRQTMEDGFKGLPAVIAQRTVSEPPEPAVRQLTMF